MLKFFSYAWKGLGLCLTLFGIFWLPKDVQDSAEAVTPWQKFIVPLITQNSALWLMAAALVAWVLYRDLRPWWRDRNNWWKGIKCFSLRNVGCLVAGVTDEKFDKSSRAKAVADEYRAYIDSGHMPLFFGDEEANFDPLSTKLAGPYGRKSVGYDAVIATKEVESLARARGWPLPWPMPDKPALRKVIQRSPADVLQALGTVAPGTPK